MNIKRIVLLSIVACLTVLFQQVDAAEKDLVVMTYNIRAGSLTTIDSLAEMIKSQNPDFVALQEVDVMTKRANAPNMNGRNIVSELAAKTDMFGYFGRTLNFAGGYYGIAILSRYPCLSMQRFMLPNPLKTEQRALLLGTFEVDGMPEVAFACTHLDVKSVETRALQADFVLDKIAGCNADIAIIGGDFNATPNEPCAKKFCNAMVNISDSAPTFPADVPDRKIDYLFMLPNDNIKATGCRVIDLPVQLSDHRAVTATIKVDCH